MLFLNGEILVLILVGFNPFAMLFPERDLLINTFFTVFSLGLLTTFIVLILNIIKNTQLTDINNFDSWSLSADSDSRKAQPILKNLIK